MNRLFIALILTNAIGCDTPIQQEDKSSPSVQVEKTTPEDELRDALLLKIQRLEKELLTLGVIKPVHVRNAENRIKSSHPDKLLGVLKRMEGALRESLELIKKVGLEKYIEITDAERDAEIAAEDAERAAKKAAAALPFTKTIQVKKLKFKFTSNRLDMQKIVCEDAGSSLKCSFTFKVLKMGIRLIFSFTDKDGVLLADERKELRDSSKVGTIARRYVYIPKDAVKIDILN